MVTKKKLLVMNTDSHELRQKLFWLKRQRIFGTQCEILVSCKTRLDKGQVVNGEFKSAVNEFTSFQNPKAKLFNWGKP